MADIFAKNASLNGFLKIAYKPQHCLEEYSDVNLHPRDGAILRAPLPLHPHHQPRHLYQTGTPPPPPLLLYPHVHTPHTRWDLLSRNILYSVVFEKRLRFFKLKRVQIVKSLRFIP